MKMKFGIILFMMAALGFFRPAPVRADEISDLKAQMQGLLTTVNALNEKIQTLEAKQESQSREIKKVPELAQKVDELKEAPAAEGGLLSGVTVGAHLKFAMFDRSRGHRNGVSEHNSLSGGFVGGHSLVLYLGKELADWLRIDVQPEIDVSASATPSLGSDITRATTSSVSTKIHQAFMTVLLPKEYELKVGTFNPMFSEDYAKETWWHYLYNMNKGTCHLLAMHDTGIELYKNFDFENWSLPVYLTYMNGGSNQNVDNNESKSVLLHIAPEFFQSRFKLLGSLAYGKWDNAGKKESFRSLAGFDWKYQKFNLLGEYVYQVEGDVPISDAVGSPTANGIDQGFWLRAIYTFNPKWRALIEQSYGNLYNAGDTGQTSIYFDKYRATSFVVDYSLTPNSTIIGQYEIGKGKRTDGSEKLDYGRFTLGWRTTF